MTPVLLVLYAVAAVLVLIPTLIERSATAPCGSGGWVLSICASLAWPVTLLCLAAHLGWRHLRAQRVRAQRVAVRA